MKTVCGNCFWWIFSICDGSESTDEGCKYILDETNEQYKDFSDCYLESIHEANEKIKRVYKYVFDLYKKAADGNSLTLFTTPKGVDE